MVGPCNYTLGRKPSIGSSPNCIRLRLLLVWPAAWLNGNVPLRAVSMGESEAGNKKGGPKAAFQRGLRWDLRLARRARGHRKLDRHRLLEVVRSGDGEGNVVDPGWRQKGRFGIAATAATAHAASCSLLHCSRSEDIEGNIKPDPGLAFLFGGKRWWAVLVSHSP